LSWSRPQEQMIRNLPFLKNFSFSKSLCISHFLCWIHVSWKFTFPLLVKNSSHQQYVNTSWLPLSDG
jgi:hypothetical protein